RLSAQGASAVTERPRLYTWRRVFRRAGVLACNWTQRQLHRHHSATALGAFERERPTMQFGCSSGDRQSEAAASCLRREERLEDLISDIQGNTGTVVAHLDDGNVARLAKRHRDPPVPRPGPEGLQHEIQERRPD